MIYAIDGERRKLETFAISRFRVYFAMVFL